MLEGSPLPESSCWQHSGTPKVLYSNTNVERYHSNKCKLLRHDKKWTEAGYLHKMEDVLLHNNTCPHMAHLTINTIQILNWVSSRAPCPQCRSGNFQFPSVWTHQECSKRSLICGWRQGEKSNEWLHKQPKTFLPEASRSLQITWQSVMRRKEIILKSNILLMSKT